MLRLGKHLNRLSSNTSIKLSTNAKNDHFFINDKYTMLTRHDVLKLGKRLADDIKLNNKILNNEKIAILCPNTYAYIVSMISVWLNHGVCLAVNRTYPNNVLKYYLNDSNCRLSINVIRTNETNADKTVIEHDKGIVDLLQQEKISRYDVIENEYYKQVNSIEDNTVSYENDLLKRFQSNDDALILYTSGSSGPPKGVVITHRNLKFHFESMIEAWKWTDKDTMLHVLPLNHVHGLLNNLLTPLYANAKVIMMEKFNATIAWSKLLDESGSVDSGISIFQAVPTVYVSLINEYYKNSSINKAYPKERVRQILRNKLRVTIAGSAPLNQQTYHDWYELTGHRMLERYGMTETGMSLTSPYTETETFKRVVGLVGRPMPGVRVRIVDSNDANKILIESTTSQDTIHEEALKNVKDDIVGDLEVRGGNVFRAYYNKPDKTKETFSDDGWFKTGDHVAFIREHNSYKILGRTSIDIIKSGGYKISAVDIEREISAHHNIFDVIVFGVKDSKWGEVVCAYIKLKEKNEYNQNEFITWCKERLPKQSVPKIIKVFDVMPRNHIGKVNKKELVKQYEKENPTN